MGQTIVEKISQQHLGDGPARELRAGDFVSLRPRHVLTHDNTAAVLDKFEAIGARALHDPSQPVFALDHDIQNTSAANLEKYARIEAFARRQGVCFYPAGAGIGHQMMIEHGHARPGSLVVASDSHANMYGAVGALGTPVVRTDAAAIWCSGEFWWQIPRTVEVRLRGELRPGVSGKDLILTLCELYDGGEVLNAAVEFSGDGVASLSMDSRLTIANMTTEWGALVGWFPCDEVTLAFLRARHQAGCESVRREDLERWEKEPPAPDADAVYAARIELDLGELVPHVAGPDTVQRGAPLPRLQAEGIRINKAYLLSCVNSRVEDLEGAAAILRGKRVADGVQLYVAAASREVQQRVESSGAWRVFEQAGAIFLPPSCGPCIGLGSGLLAPGEVGISATNRNFKGRMGAREARCYLASPQVVAASALAGMISGAGEWADREPARSFEEFAPPAEARDERVEILAGFPERVRGRLLFLPVDNLNTDGIYGKDYTYREDIDQETMARVAMENYDPRFGEIARAGDLIAAGWNFGTGSSREQAVTALQAKGIALVIAGSFSQTYLRNAFNNGFLCVVQPQLAEHLKGRFGSGAGAGERTLVASEDVEVDFTNGTIALGAQRFRFPPLGPVPQSLVVAGGIENLVRTRLGLGNH